MSIAGEEELQNMDHVATDPLLKPGAFIDPNPSLNGNSKPESSSDRPETPQPSHLKGGSDPPLGDRPDWLPPGWTFVERVRSSGASAGSRDKYFMDPVTNRRFRSKKEVLLYLETGTVAFKKKKNSDTDGTPQSSGPTPKRKKSEPEVKDITKYFNFDGVPAKVKWELSDVYEGSWRPLINGVDRVPESTKQDWVAAFTYLTLQNGGR